MVATQPAILLRHQLLKFTSTQHKHRSSSLNSANYIFNQQLNELSIQGHGHAFMKSFIRGDFVFGIWG